MLQQVLEWNASACIPERKEKKRKESFLVQMSILPQDYLSRE